MPVSFAIFSKPKKARDVIAISFPSGIKVLYEPQEPNLDIVFVHGLSGDRERTWSLSQGLGCWPQDLLPKEVPEARILTFGYDAYIIGTVSNNKIRDHARNLVNELVRVRTNGRERRPIIFVVHSLGGLVCKDALHVSTNNVESHLQAIAAATCAVLFAATPHEGSSMANWAKIPASTLGIVKQGNVNLLAILHTTSEVRDRIQDDFLSLLRRRQLQGPPLDVTCLFETLRTGPFTIVPKNSAVLPGYNSIPIRADHRDIVRWREENSEGYDAIIQELRRWKENLQAEYGRIETVDSDLVHRCIDSLAFPQIFDRQAAIERAADDTCAWILDTPEYQAWLARQVLDKSHGLFWIKGKPGSGKSTLMKFLCEQSPPRPGSMRLTFFFNARGSELEKSLLGLYRTLLLQLLKEERNLPAMKPFLNKLLGKEKLLGKGKCTWHLKELQDAFHKIVMSGELPPLELLVDALDECDETQVRQFVRHIGILAAEATSKELIFNVCWSSRHYPHISTKHSFEIRMEDQNKADIQKFVRGELMACGTLETEVRFDEEIVDRARGVFLWATLVVQRLVRAADQGASTAHMLDLLGRLPTELDDLLREIFDAIDPIFQSETRHLIQWTLFAQRPLYLEELKLALAFSTNSSPPASLGDFSSSLQSWEEMRRDPRYIMQPNCTSELDDLPDSLDLAMSNELGESDPETANDNGKPEVETYDEGHRLIVKDAESNLLATVWKAGNSPDQIAAVVEREQPKLNQKTPIEHTKHKRESNEKPKGESFEQQLQTIASHPGNKLRKQLHKWRGWGARKDDENERAEPEAGLMSNAPKMERRSARAYQSGNAITVEDEDGDVLEICTVPGAEHQHKADDPATSSQLTKLDEPPKWEDPAEADDHAKVDETAEWDYFDRADDLTDADRLRLAAITENLRARSEGLRRYVTAISGGLVEVVIQLQDSQVREYVQVIHEAVRDFFLQPQAHTRLGLDQSADFASISANTLFQACRNFISCPEFRYCLPPAFSSIFERAPADLAAGWRWTGYPFTAYVVEFLFDHATAADALRRSLDGEEKDALKELFRRWMTVLKAVHATKDRSERESCDYLLLRVYNLVTKQGILLEDSEIDQEMCCNAKRILIHLNLHFQTEPWLSLAGPQLSLTSSRARRSSKR